MEAGSILLILTVCVSKAWINRNLTMTKLLKMYRIIIRYFLRIDSANSLSPSSGISVVTS